MCIRDRADALLLADVGVVTTDALVDGVRNRVGREGVVDVDGLLRLLKAEILARLGETDRNLALGGEPSVWLLVGVNGVGKTTTIGKLGHRESMAGRRVVFAAGDTFRAAAADQLSLWADRSGLTVVRGAEGADPSSVVFDAVDNPLETRLLREAKECGCAQASGLDMFVGQAARQFSLFTGEEPALDLMRAAVLDSM